MLAPNPGMEPLIIEFFEYLGAFAAILANFKLAQDKIRNGITNPTQIFAEKHEDVVLAWQAFENRRKTMTYLPYKY